MAWIYLTIAGLLEIGWAVGLKLSDGWTRFWPSVVTLILIFFSYLFLSIALRSLPLGTAYAVWTGIGAVGVAIVGMLHFGEPREFLRIVFMAMIVVGIIGLKVMTRSARSGAL